MEGGAPKGRRLESPRYEREYEESGLSYRHPERSRGIFAIRGQGLTLSPHVPRTSPLFTSVFRPARTLSGSLRSPPSPWGKAYDTGYTFLSFVFMPSLGAFASCYPTVPFSRVQGRFLAALEMTIRGKRYSHFVDFSHREVSGAWALRFYMPAEQPLEEGARRRRRIDLPRRGSLLRGRMKSHVRSPVLSYPHPERSRGIFYVVAVLCTYEVMIKSRGCFGCSSSDALRLIVVQGRFLAALEMTRGGRTVIRGRAFSLFASPTFSAKRSHSLRKERLRNHHFPPMLSAFSHRLAPRGSFMDFFKNKRVSPHFLQI